MKLPVIEKATIEDWINHPFSICLFNYLRKELIYNSEFKNKKISQYSLYGLSQEELGKSMINYTARKELIDDLLSLDDQSISSFLLKKIVEIKE